jgi:hypothetical protein
MRVLESFLPPPPQQHDSEEEEDEAQKSDGDEYEEDYENSGEESGRKTDRTDGEANSEAAEGHTGKPSSRGSLGQQKQQPEHEVAGNRVVKISAGFAHSAALTADGRLFLWGFGKSSIICLHTLDDGYVGGSTMQPLAGGRLHDLKVLIAF